MADFISKQEAVPTHELGEEDRECVICTTQFGDRMGEGTIEHAVRLTCKHIAGSLCLQGWLKTSRQCPFCRAELFPEPHEPLEPIHFDHIPLVTETTIGEEEERLLEEFENCREPTADEIDELEATGSTLRFADNSGANAIDPETQPWRAASTRRRADRHSRDLYDEIRTLQIRSGVRESELLPVLERWELVSGTLSWDTDLKLFKYLQADGAFCFPGMLDVRFSLRNPSDECLYDHLRNQGARWDVARYGWFQYGRRMFFGTATPELSPAEEEFEQLKAQGAFRTLGVNRSFRDVRTLFHDDSGMLTPTDWEIWTRIQQDGMHWNEDDRCWRNEGRTRVAYGDLPSNARLRSERILQDLARNLTCYADSSAEVVNYVENLHIRIRD